MSQFNQPIGSRSQQSYVKPHRGTLVLVLGIISLVPGLNICGVLGILAWVFGSSDLKEMQAGTMDREGEGPTRAGYICGIISTCLAALGIVLVIIYLIFIFLVLGLGAAAAGAGAGM